MFVCFKSFCLKKNQHLFVHRFTRTFLVRYIGHCIVFVQFIRFCKKTLVNEKKIQNKMQQKYQQNFVINLSTKRC